MDTRGLQIHVVICKCMQRFVFACLSSYAANHQSAVVSSELKHEITGLHAVLSPVNMVRLPPKTQPARLTGQFTDRDYGAKVMYSGSNQCSDSGMKNMETGQG